MQRNRRIEGMTGDVLGSWNPNTHELIDVQGRTAIANTYLEALDIMRERWSWVVLYQM